jgi:hypothetical protein
MRSPSQELHKGEVRSARVMAAEQAGYRILHRLNNGPETPASERVLWLLQALRRLEELRMMLFAPYQAGQPRRDIRAQREFRSLVSDIAQRLERYHWTPTVFDLGDYFRLETGFNWSKKTSEETWENENVFYLLDQAKEGSLGHSSSHILRFRQCLQCKTWFYALTDHQDHCSERCRKRFYSHNPEFKKKRADYMRDRWRPQKKEREARQDAVWLARHKQQRGT